MKLSPNFSLKEMCYSTTAIRNDIENLPNQEQLVCLTSLAWQVLQPIREEMGRIDVNSGLRSEKLNQLVNGSRTSDHCKGKAADIEANDIEISNLQLAEWISKNLTFKQCILEHYHPDKIGWDGKPEGNHSGWVHVSFDPGGDNQCQLLTAKRVNGKTKYLEGFVID